MNKKMSRLAEIAGQHGFQTKFDESSGTLELHGTPDHDLTLVAEFAEINGELIETNSMESAETEADMNRLVSEFADNEAMTV